MVRKYNGHHDEPLSSSSLSSAELLHVFVASRDVRRVDELGSAVDQTQSRPVTGSKVNNSSATAMDSSKVFSSFNQATGGFSLAFSSTASTAPLSADGWHKANYSRTSQQTLGGHIKDSPTFRSLHNT